MSSSTGPSHHLSPDSSPEVNVTCSTDHHGDLLDEHVHSASQISSTVNTDTLEEEVDIPEADEADVRFLLLYPLRGRHCAFIGTYDDPHL